MIQINGAMTCEYSDGSSEPPSSSTADIQEKFSLSLRTSSSHSLRLFFKDYSQQINNLDAILCNCSSTWADMPEVTPVYVAKSDEPLSAQILHNTSARGKKSQHRAIDLLEPTI